MGVREQFEQQLIDVQQDLMRLADRSIAALEQAFEAFRTQHIDKALQVIEQDAHINRLEEAIHDRVILLIAKQQPVATDLRRLMVIVKAASDYERIGDYAVNIAKDAIRIQEPFITSIEPIEQLHALTVSMLQNIAEAFLEENMMKAQTLAQMDDEIDALYGSAMTTFMRIAPIMPEHIGQVTHLAFICRHLERCADHGTNIAEHLMYIVKGKHYELNN